MVVKHKGYKEELLYMTHASHSETASRFPDLIVVHTDTGISQYWDWLSKNVTHSILRTTETLIKVTIHLPLSWH